MQKNVLGHVSFMNYMWYKAETYHLSLSLALAENVELLSTSPISSRQKLKLLIVHMYENFTTFTYNEQTLTLIKGTSSDRCTLL